MLDAADADAATSEPRSKRPPAAFAPGHRTEGRLGQRCSEYGNLYGVSPAPAGSERRDGRCGVDAKRVLQAKPTQPCAELADVPVPTSGFSPSRTTPRSSSPPRPRAASGASRRISP